jgi:hypothetical protein
MKKSKTPNKDMTIEDVMRIFVYRPYKDKISVKVDDKERIYIKGDRWIVILDHNTGELEFKGELHKYYDIDMITSIRDSFGCIYSWFNVKYDSLPVGEWIDIVDELVDGPGESYIEKKKASSDRVLQYKKDYYQQHREEIRKKQSSYYYRKKMGLI